MAKHDSTTYVARRKDRDRTLIRKAQRAAKYGG